MRHRSIQIVPFIGYVVLSIFVLLLFGSSFYVAWDVHATVGGVVFMVIMGGLLYQTALEYRRLPDVDPPPLLSQVNLLNFGAVFLGAVSTYVLNIDVELGAVTASGLVGVIAALVAPAYGVPLYCGSFVGMTSAQFLSSHTELAIAGLIAGAIYVLTTGVYDGFGGKLGTIAFAGCVITGMCLRREFVIASVPIWRIAGQIVLYAILAAVITRWLSINRGHGAVMASGAVGLVGGLILPAVYPVDVGRMLAVVVICASFAGMSAPARFPKLWAMLIVGLFTGIAFVYSMPVLGGAGGKLGTLALGAGLAAHGYMTLLEGDAQ
ncbi:MAG: hypothetical protein ACLFTI_13355 [Anaerolineales bacterium]